jgi:hypothetical protein
MHIHILACGAENISMRGTADLSNARVLWKSDISTRVSSFQVPLTLKHESRGNRAGLVHSSQCTDKYILRVKGKLSDETSMSWIYLFLELRPFKLQQNIFCRMFLRMSDVFRGKRTNKHTVPLISSPRTAG